MIGRLGPRATAAAALALPVLALIAYMLRFDAPRSYLAIDAVSLIAALAWVAAGRAPDALRTRRILTAGLVLLLFVPLVTGPQLNGIARWLPLGPVNLHAGMFALPAITVLAARDVKYAPLVLSTVLLAALLQPDGGTGFAVTFATVGLYHVTRDWRFALLCIVSFFASLIATLDGELPPQPFVEHVLQDALATSPLAALALATALAVSFALMLFASPLEREARFALGGALFGFFIIALMNTYPYPLIGHGAAPILGFGLALGLVRRETP